MIHRSLATLFIVGLAFLAQLSATVFHAPPEITCSAESASVEAQAEHEEEVVQDVALSSEGTRVHRWRPDDRLPPASAHPDEILHVPRA
ncbi:MAG TPA: hypothetical protein VGK67_19640 [Myxococcales bacterium]|jgi:hypothetical protein